MRTSELTGALLDYWVARAEGKDGQIVKSTSPCNLDYFELKSGTPFRPSTHWAHGGPLIEQRAVDVGGSQQEWWALVEEKTGGIATGEGPTLLIAICRAIVCARFGHAVDDLQPPAES